MIIGAMKSGTSSLYNYIVGHPNICPCVKKEPEFFSSNQGHKYRAVEKYEELWDYNPREHRYVIEASTGYTKYPSEPNVPEAIHNYGVSPKIIYIVRNPFERIISQYSHLKYRHHAENRPLSLLSDDMIDVSKYYMQLSRYIRFFPQKQFLIVDFDDIKKDPKILLTNVFAFLDLDAVDFIDSIDYLVHNKSFTRSRFDLLLQKRPYLKKIYALVPSAIKKRAKEKFQSYSLPEKPVRFTEGEKEIAFAKLSADMRMFQDTFGFNVAKWGF